MRRLPGTSVVTEVNLQSQLAELCREVDAVDVAVSYVGRDAYQFFPADRLPSKMTFLIDMSRSTVAAGLTNPQGVDRLLQLGTVKSLAGLHAKVFLFSDKAAIVGSANLSASSIESQYQCCLMTRDKAVISDLRDWFTQLWDAGSALDYDACKVLMKYFPTRTRSAGAGKRSPLSKLRRWHAPLLESAHFQIGLSASEKRRALHLFQSSRCGYDHDVTCALGARGREQELRDYSKKLQALLRRIDHWTRADAERLFNLACIDGPGRICRRSFLKQPIRRIRCSMRYLFFGGGSPLVRFEKVAGGAGPYRLYGLARAGVAMLMHLWQPNEFAIWNEATEKGLRVLKVTFDRGPSKHLGQAYMDRTEAMKEIMQVFRFRSLAEADHFVDAFGKKHLML